MTTAGPSGPRAPASAGSGRGRGYLAVLSVAALGVVYGDIGTSPLYALRECFFGPHGIAASRENVLGVLSLIFWALTLLVSIKYVAFVLRVDSEGEGGILALVSLVRGTGEGGDARVASVRARQLLLVLGLFGAALLYGDGLLTPAISVLSAVEGLEVATPVFAPFVVPIAVAILVGLFVLQKFGTGRVGAVFGPIIAVWFVVIAVLGALELSNDPSVLAAVNPVHALRFLVVQGPTALFVLGAVFLAVTGAEALYADLGHFGRAPIRLSWFLWAFPALVLNYFGQGALLLADPDSARNPFYLLAPDWALYPLVVLATLATIIASQAIITGVFSLTMQAMHLGYSPRLDVRHTSERERGQIYVPPLNWVLMVATVVLVLEFRSSSSLAGAYGIAVAATMLITTILFLVVARRLWRWSPLRIALFGGVFLTVEMVFVSANLLKLGAGGWVPLGIAAFVMLLMITWRQGTKILGARLAAESVLLEEFLDDLAHAAPQRVPGTAIFMTGNPLYAPPPLIRNLEHNKVLHERVAIMSIRLLDVPHVPQARRVHVEELAPGMLRVVARFGFMDEPRMARVLLALREAGHDIDPRQSTFFLGRERLLSPKHHGLGPFRGKLYAFMAHNALPATAFFQIPPDRVVEMGAQVELTDKWVAPRRSRWMPRRRR